MPPKKNDYIRTIPNDYTKYSPLGPDEIRLLRIRKPPRPPAPTHTTDDPTIIPPIQCELYRVKLPTSQRPPFTALSYCWGDLRHTLPITVVFRDAELLQPLQPFSQVNNDGPSLWNLPPPTTSPVPDPVIEDFNVTTNLHAALSAFRSDPSFKEDQFLWIDMLCINQDNLAERSYQVSLMKNTYDGSSMVEVWLGSGGEEEDGTVKGLLRPEDDLLTDELMDAASYDDAAKAMKEAEEWAQNNWEETMMRLTPTRFVERLRRDEVTRFAWVVLMRSGVLPTGEGEDDEKGREEIFESLVGDKSEFFDTIIFLLQYILHLNDPGKGEEEDDEDTRLWVTGNKFYQRVMRLSQLDWFRRIWVIQEVVYSKQTFVRHGNTRIRWNSMLNLVRIKGMLMLARWNKKMFSGVKYGEDELQVPRLWKEGLTPSAQLDWNSTPGYAMLPSLSPLEVIFQTSAFIATDPRDRLFGILSLIPSSSSGPNPYLPDYKKSIVQASCDFTKWHVEALGSWDVLSLCRPRGQRSFFRDSSLPSWAIDFKKDYGEIPPFALRKHADGSPMFSAGISCPQPSSRRHSYRIIRNPISLTPEEDSNRITLAGCIIARITKVWSLNMSTISQLSHPSLWAKGELPPPPPPQPEPTAREAPVAKSFLDALRALKAGLNPLPTSPSSATEQDGQDREVDPIRWKSAMASHAARIIRELWETVFYPYSGLPDYHHHHHLRSHRHYSLDDMDASGLFTTPLSNLHTLLTGLALSSRLSMAEVALLFHNSLYPEANNQVPFFIQAHLTRLARAAKSPVDQYYDPFIHQAINWAIFGTDDGRIGVAHDYAKVDDSVLVVEGARTGYIVRPVLDSKKSRGLDLKNGDGTGGKVELVKGREWKIVGECLLAGRMYAEESVVGDALYDDVLEADVVGRSRYREEYGGRVRGGTMGKGGWKYRRSFWMEPVTLV